MNMLTDLTVQGMVSSENGEAKTTSYAVAEAFGKRHSDVLRAIKNMKCSAKFRARNFAFTVENKHLGNTKRNTGFYQMTKDGWMFLVMGFNGEKADAIKEQFIDAFNWMTEQLTQTFQSKWARLNHLCQYKDNRQLQVRWASVFGEKRPLFLEVGMGKGRFLMDMARLHPERNYVGIEMYDSVLLRALQKREELEEAGEKFSNLVFIRVDARLLPEIFEKDEVDGIYLNFSDPWPKARHAKRRLTSREFLKRYEQVLKKEGTVEFKTDNRGLFEFSLEEVKESDWNLEVCTFDLHHDEELVKGNVMTEYEEKFSSMGNPICKMVIRQK